MSRIPKDVFALQSLTRDPLLIRYLSRKTMIPRDELREAIPNIESKRDPLFRQITRFIDVREQQIRR